MGDPKKTRKTYYTPHHPWKRIRIDEERIIKEEYGMKNKREIFKMSSLLKDFKNQAKKLIALRTAQADKEKEQMFARLKRLGILAADVNSLDPVLDLTLRDILERRLQTQVYKKNLARTINQARQFIVHGHIKVGDRKVTAPSYLVAAQEEMTLSFSDNSSLNNLEHPERYAGGQKTPEQAEKELAKKKKKDAARERMKNDRGRGSQKRKFQDNKNKHTGGVKNG
jgi:small subunit ribosomal protein S4